MSEQQTHEPSDPVAVVLRWRRREALEAGCSWDEANEYARSDFSAQEFRDLLKQGWNPDVIVRVLL